MCAEHGTVFVWQFETSARPVAVLDGVTQIAVGSEHALALKNGTPVSCSV